MKYKDYYAALGIPRDADDNAVRKAYRKLARQYHPDVSKSADAEARFKEVAEAYATLKDPEKRAAYDQLGQRRSGEEFAPPPDWRHGYADTAHAFEDVDLADLLDALGRGYRRAGARAQPVHGRDLEAVVRLTLEQAHHGTTTNLELGDESGRRTLEVVIPAGVTDGQRLRLRGKGGAGRNGGANGDIYLHIALAQHPIFRVDGHDLYFDLALAPWEAALGTEIEIATLDGPLLLSVPAGMRSSRKLRLRGRGLSNGRGGRGDLYAIVHVDVPDKLTLDERKLFEQLAKISRFNPRAAAARSPHATTTS